MNEDETKGYVFAPPGEAEKYIAQDMLDALAAYGVFADGTTSRRPPKPEAGPCPVARSLIAGAVEAAFSRRRDGEKDSA